MAKKQYVSARSTNQLQQKAYEWREVLGVSNSTNFDLLDLLENKLPEYIPEFSLKVAADDESDIEDEAETTFGPPTIQARRDTYAAAKNGDPRAKFTLAHELGHLVLHNAFPESVLARSNVYYLDGPEGEKFRDAEWQANMFANRFLMPENIVKNYESAEDISLDFGVSHEAAKVRLDQLERSKPRTIPDHIKDTINEFKRNHGFPEIE